MVFLLLPLRLESGMRWMTPPRLMSSLAEIFTVALPTEQPSTCVIIIDEVMVKDAQHCIGNIVKKNYLNYILLVLLYVGDDRSDGHLNFL